MQLTTSSTRPVRRRVAKTMAAGLGALVLCGAASAPAHADWIYDLTSDPSPGYPEFSTDPANVYRTGPGRCDVTLQFRGVTNSALLFSYQGFDSDGSKPWSPWLRQGETWSHSFYEAYGTIPRIWKAQPERSASIRLRVSGACYIPYGTQV